MTIEQHIAELRAELRNAAHPAERREIAAELERARAELAAKLTEAAGLTDAKPPF